MFDEHLEEVIVVEVETLLLFHFLKLFLVNPAHIHKEEVGLVLNFYIQLSVLIGSCLSDDEPECEHFLYPHLFSLLVDLPNLNRDLLVVDYFHISL